MKRVYAVAFMALLFTVIAIMPVLGARNDQVVFNSDVQVGLDQVIDGGLIVFGGDASIAGTVNGDVVILGGDAILKSTAEVKGNVLIFGGKAQKATGSKVRDQVIEGIPLSRSIVDNIATLSTYGFLALILRILGLIAMLAIAAIVVAVLPQQEKLAVAFLESNLIRSFVIGLIGIICIPAVIVLLIVTLIGIPLIPVLVLLIIAAFIFGHVAISYWLGQRLLAAVSAKQHLPLWSVLLGVAVIGILSWIPLAGPLLSGLANICGLGAVLGTRFGTGRPWFAGKQGKEQHEIGALPLS